MALVLADRVRDTTASTGTGAVTLSGTAPIGFQNFTAVGNGNTTYYTIDAGSQWEVGIGTYSSTGPTLSRDTVLSSSNAGALVNFASGNKDVFVTYPSGKSVYSQASGNVGIGTTGPTDLLDVTVDAPLAGYNDFVVFRQTNGVGTNSRMLFGQNSTNNMFVEVANQANVKGNFLLQPFGGNVGIGTGAPGSLLDVNGNAATRGTAFFGASLHGNIGSDSNTIYVRGNNVAFQNAAASTTYAYISSSGNFGINTAAPAKRLTVVSTAYASGEFSSAVTAAPASVDAGEVFTLSGNSAVSGVTFSGSDPRLLAFGVTPANNVYVRANEMDLIATGSLRLSTNTTERMRINTNGDVGVGTTAAPQSRMEIRATAGGVMFNALTLSNYVGFTAGTAVALYFDPNGAGTLARAASIRSTQVSAANVADLRFFTANSDTPAERMQIDAAGNVLLGTPSLATTAVEGFPYIPTCAGAPTGTPTGKTGFAPMVVDSTNNKLYVYIGGAWRIMN